MKSIEKQHSRGRSGAGAGIARSLALALAIGLASGRARAAVYYVDASSGTCSPAGPGTLAHPYCSIGAALAAHPDSGVTVVVNPGIYREKVLIVGDGTAVHPIVVHANGPGVVIDGADDFSQPGQWVHLAGDVWLAAGVNWEPAQVFADGGRLARSDAGPLDIEPGRWRYVAGTGLYANLYGDDPASHQAAVGRRSHGFFVQGHSHIVIDGFTIQRTEDKCIEVIDASWIVIKRNQVSGSGSGGIAAESSSNIRVLENVARYNNHHGILFRDNVTSSIIDDNESYGNAHIGESWATGIYLAGSPGNLVECNNAHDNQDSGIEIQTGSNDCTVRQNLAWRNGDHGVAHLDATGTIDMGNVAWGNRHQAFAVQGNATGTQLYNCIGVDRELEPNTYCVFVDSSSTAGFQADFNIFWDTAGGAPIKFGKTVYPNNAAFLAATGIGPHTFGADPRFEDVQNGDFALLPGSPAIDDASSSVPGWTATDAAGHTRDDDPSTPNTGAGPIGYADRGAIEYFSGVLAVGGGVAPPRFGLSSAFPNPSRRNVAFTLELPAAADVSWNVFDVAGREVWGGSGPRPAGPSTLSWALTDRAGARVRSGVYLVRVNQGRESATMRFVVMP